MRMSSRIYETIASKHNTYDDDLLQVPTRQQQVKVEPWLFVTAEIWRRCFHFDSLIVGHRFIISGRTAPLVFVTQFHRKKQSDSHEHNLQHHRWMHFFFSHLSCANFGRYNTNVFDIKISQDGQLLNITAKKLVKTWREITK